MFPNGIHQSKENKELQQWWAQRKNMLPLFTLQAILALCLTVIVLYGGYYYCSWIPEPLTDDFITKLTYTLSCSTFVLGIVLFAMIVNVGLKRSTGPARNPLSGAEHLVQREKNILANTLEQIVLFFLLSLSLTVYITPSEMRLIPLYTVLFVIARVLFLVGYSIHTDYRGLGIMTNFMANIFVIGLVGYLSIGYMIFPLGLVLFVPLIDVARPLLSL